MVSRATRLAPTQFRWILTYSLTAYLIDGREASGARDAIEQPVGDRDSRTDRVPHAHWQGQGECRQQDRDAPAARLTPTQHEGAPRRSPTPTHLNADDASAAPVAARLNTSTTPTLRSIALPESMAVLTMSASAVCARWPAETTRSTVSWPAVWLPPRVSWICAAASSTKRKLPWLRSSRAVSPSTPLCVWSSAAPLSTRNLAVSRSTAVPVTSASEVLAWVPTTATRSVPAASSRLVVGVANKLLLLNDTSASVAEPQASSSDHALSAKPAAGLVCAVMGTSNSSSRKRGERGITASRPGAVRAVCTGLAASVALPYTCTATLTCDAAAEENQPGGTVIEQSPTPLATEPWAHGEEVSAVPDGPVATICTARPSEETSDRPSASRSRKDARSAERSA
eukprot:scaffold39280_cov77-Phaeocystis_antarctica.AAC.2